MPAQPLDARAGAARRLPGGPGGGRKPRAQPGAARDARLAGAQAFRKDDAPAADQEGNAMINVANWILARASIDNSRKYSNRQSHQGSNVGILERWLLSNTK